MCTVLLPPGGYPIAVNKYISYHISYHIIYHIISYIPYIIIYSLWSAESQFLHLRVFCRPFDSAARPPSPSPHATPLAKGAVSELRTAFLSLNLCTSVYGGSGHLGTQRRRPSLPNRSVTGTALRLLKSSEEV
jgi:hypothetical protein